MHGLKIRLRPIYKQKYTKHNTEKLKIEQHEHHENLSDLKE